MRAACRPRDVQLDPVALGLQGPPGPKGEAGVQGPPGPGLVVKDANGATVGVVADTGTTQKSRSGTSRVEKVLLADGDAFPCHFRSLRRGP